MYYDEIIKLDDQEAGAYYGKAIIYDDQGKENEAEKYYQKAIMYDQDYYHAYLYLADIYERKNYLDKAEAYYLKALDLGPYHIWSYINYGAYLESHQRDVHAFIIFTYANHLFHDHYLIYFNLAVVSKKIGDLDLSRYYYERSIELNLKHPYSFLNLAILYKEAGDYQKALLILDRGIRYNHETSVLYYNRSIFNTYLAYFNEAKEDLLMSIKISNSLSSYAKKDEELQALFLRYPDLLK